MQTHTEHRARTIDACCKMVATAGIIVGGLFGLINYLSSRDHELYIRQAEASKPAVQARLQLCMDLTTASGKAATTTNPEEQALAKKEFEQIYWGPFGLVKNSQVEQAAENFDICLRDSSKCDPSVEVLSQRLSLMCRGSLGPNWGFPLAPNAPKTLEGRVSSY
jgi:hypothetical protein